MKGGDATVVTRTVNEWVQKTSLALSAWSPSAVQNWHQAVTSARAAHQQWTMLTPAQRAQKTGSPSTGHALPLQMTVVEATMRAELCSSCLPEKVQSLAIQKNAATMSDLLYLTFQTYLPSEPAARVDGLTSVENVPKAASCQNLFRNPSVSANLPSPDSDCGDGFELKGNPEPLQFVHENAHLFIGGYDTAFAMEVSQIYRTANVKVLCSDQTFIAAFTQKARGRTRPSLFCRGFMTDERCKRGQCSFQHPATIGRRLRCGSTRHMVEDCKRPRKDVSTGKGKATPAPKPKQIQEPNRKEAWGRQAPRRDLNRNSQAKLKQKPRLLQLKLLPGTLRLTGPLYLNHHFLLVLLLQEFTTHAPSTPLFIRLSIQPRQGWCVGSYLGYRSHTLPFTVEVVSTEQAPRSKRIHLKVANGTSVRALLYHSSIVSR